MQGADTTSDDATADARAIAMPACRFSPPRARVALIFHHRFAMPRLLADADTKRKHRAPGQLVVARPSSTTRLHRRRCCAISRSASPDAPYITPGRAASILATRRRTSRSGAHFTPAVGAEPAAALFEFRSRRRPAEGLRAPAKDADDFSTPPRRLQAAFSPTR